VSDHEGSGADELPAIPGVLSSVRRRRRYGPSSADVKHPNDHQDQTPLRCKTAPGCGSSCAGKALQRAHLRPPTVRPHFGRVTDHFSERISSGIPTAHQQKRGPWVGAPFLWGCVRRCPTLPHPGGCSTIGAGGLSFRVRDGSGRFPSAMAAVTCVELSGVCPCSGSCTVDAFCGKSSAY
jgi:hypothetical protein